MLSLCSLTSISNLFSFNKNLKLVICLALLPLVTLSAGDPTPGLWVGGTDDNWTTAANWNDNTVPGPTINVVIDVEGANVQLPADPITIASLTLGAGDGGTTTISTLFNAGENGLRLTVTGAVIINSDGVLNLDGYDESSTYAGDSLIAPTGITNFGLISVKYSSIIVGAVANNGVLTVQYGESTITGPLTNLASAQVNIQSNNYSSARLVIDSSFTNSGAVVLEDLGSKNFPASLTVHKGWLTNAATGTITQTVYSTLDANINNQGTITVDSNSPWLGITWTNDSLTVINSGLIDVQGGRSLMMKNIDSLVILEGGVLSIATGARLIVNGIAAAGYWPVPDAKFVIDPEGMIDLNGIIEGNYITLDPGPLFHIDVDQQVILKNTHVVSDSVNNQGHLTLENVSIAGIMTNTDTILVSVGGLKVDGTLINQEGAYIKVAYSSGTSLISNNIENHGEMVLSDGRGSNLGSATATITNSATGSIIAEMGEFPSTILKHRLYGQLVNHGDVRLSAPTQIEWNDEGEHLNDGTLKVESTFEVYGTASFTNLVGGTISGKGSINVSPFDKTFINAGTIAPGGSPGILTFIGDLKLTPTSIIALELSGSDPGTENDQLVVTQNLSMGGSLNVTSLEGFSPSGNETLPIITWGTSLDMFDVISVPSSAFVRVEFGDMGLFLVDDLGGTGNSRPFMAGVADLVVAEDTTLNIILSAFDPNGGDVLTFGALADMSAVIFTIVDDTLKVSTEPNWTGTAMCTTWVSDGELSDSTEFTIQFLPVQDAPLPFALLEPGDTTIAINTSSMYDVITLSWEAAVDPDGEPVDYGVLFSEALEIVPEHQTGGSTYLGWTLSEIVAPMQTAGLLHIEGTWDVWASDGIDTIWASNGPWPLAFNDHVLVIDGRMGIPTAYNLYPNFPNPFNPSSTIQYDLPEASFVSLIVYDVMGREVIRLTDEAQQPGYYEMVWDATDSMGRNVPTGMYIARLITTDFRKSIKMLLLK